MKTCFSLTLAVLAVSARVAAQDDLGKRERKSIVIQWAKYNDAKNYAIEYESIIPKATVKQVADALEEVLTQYVLVFKFKPTEKLKVKFLDSPNTYEQEGGIPSSAGVFLPPTGYLVLKQLPFYELTPTAYHEAFHQYLHFYVGKETPIPIWFNEGIAGFYQEIQKTKGTKKLDYKLIDNRKLRMVKDKVATRTAIPLEKLIDSSYNDFHDHENPANEQLHYTQSFAVIYFFMQAMGGQPIYQFTEELKKTKDAKAAEEKLFGKDRKGLKSIEAKWKAYLLQVKIDEKTS